MRLLPRRRPQELACREVVEMVTDYLDGALSPAARRSFEAHLAQCENCSAYLEQIRRTIELTGAVGPEDLTPQMRDELGALYRRWRAEEEDGNP
jgi:anti-sigma factor RsiW